MITQTEVAKTLNNRGVRPSLHRTEVMRYLIENHTHPSVDTIYEALSPRIPTLSRTTIYNILNLFVEKGLVSSITIDPRQCRYDGNTEEHVHFLCVKCGGLYDIFTHPVKVDTNHVITETQIYLKGICEHCK